MAIICVSPLYCYIPRIDITYIIPHNIPISHSIYIFVLGLLQIQIYIPLAVKKKEVSKDNKINHNLCGLFIILYFIFFQKIFTTQVISLSIKKGPKYGRFRKIYADPKNA